MRSTAGALSVVAGNGTAGFSGDGGPAASAELNTPLGVAVDAAGNLYISDSGNNRIRKVSSGVITTLAGNGTAGYAGDGGPASSAEFNLPDGIAVDAAGALYIADRNNSRIRKIANGAITTIAQDLWPIDVAVDAAGDVYIVDSSNQVQEFSGGALLVVAGDGAGGDTGDGGPAVNAEFISPAGIAVDSTGNLYISDATSDVVREVMNGIIHTIAGEWATVGADGTAGETALSQPEGLAVDSAGYVYVADYGSSTVRMLTPSGIAPAGSISQLASGGAWNTTITLVNTGPAAVETVLNFFDDDGYPLQLPLVFPQTSAASPLLASTLDRTIGAGAQLVIQTAGSAGQAVVEGWAQVMASGPVGGQAVFAESEAIGLQESVSPLETRNPSAFFLPFNCTNSYQTGIAIANLTNQTVSVPVKLYGSGGSSLPAVPAIKLAPYGHTAFMLVGIYPEVANQFGSLELDTPAGGQISALGIRAAPDGALTSLPVFASTDASNGTMAQLAVGDSWNITVTLENTSAAAPAQATLTFFDDYGDPLPLPLTYPLSGSTAATTASTVTQTIAPDASLVIATAAPPSAALSEGWAQLTVTGGSVGGSEVYGYTTSGNLQEAAVGVETRNPSTGFLLPFNYTNGYQTGIALANLTNQTVTIPVKVLDDSGNPLVTSPAPITLGPHAHEAFMLAASYPAVSGGFGTLELDQPAASPSGAQISVIGIRATPGNAITSVPVLVK
jgi:sugar lactone lactonase YvrE